MLPMKRRNLKLIIVFLIVFFYPLQSFLYNRSSESQDSFVYSDPIRKLMIKELSAFDKSNYVDEEFERFRQFYSLRGISIAIIKNEKLIFSRAYGYANTKDKIKTTPEHSFRLASVSKLITAVAIMKLVEQGKITLDDKVFGKDGIINDQQYLDIKDPQLLDITVLNLLNHSGGWTQRYGDPMFNPLRVAELVKVEPPVTVDTFIKFAIKRRLHFKPGTMNSYSNMGYLFLGEVIERVTKKPYDEWVKKEILKPMGIRDMEIANNLFEDRYAQEVTYYDQSDSCFKMSFTGDSALVPKMYGGNDVKLLGAAGGWIASSIDLSKFLVHIDGFNEVKDIISEASFNQMSGGLGETLGWKELHDDGIIRTGTFAGTAAVLYRGNDGTEWVFLSNTSTWKGPYFSRIVAREMRKILNKVDSWPDVDLLCLYN